MMTPTTTTARRTAAPGKREQVKLSQIVRTVKEDPEAIEKEGSKDIKIGVEFKLIASEAKSVTIAGDFNGWNAKKTPMKKNGDVWEAKVELPRGRYEYRFVVDGTWVSDPSAKESTANPFGSNNSVLSL
jgi:1,4-alpha-glucan branching enzyme